MALKMQTRNAVYTLIHHKKRSAIDKPYKKKESSEITVQFLNNMPMQSPCLMVLLKTLREGSVPSSSNQT
jgi:hypothetical protein